MYWANIPQLIRPFTPQSTSLNWKERGLWLRDSDPSGDSEGLSSSGLSCKPVSGSPRASSGVSSLHKPTNKATSRQELSQDSWPPILPYMPGRKGGHLPICSQLGIQPPPPPPPFPLPSPDSPVDSLLRLPALLASWERNGLSRPLWACQ